MNLNKQPVDVDALIDDMLEARRVLDTKIDALVQHVGGSMNHSDMIIDSGSYIYFFFDPTRFRTAKDVGHTQRNQLADVVFSREFQGFTKCRNSDWIMNGLISITGNEGKYDSMFAGSNNGILYFTRDNELVLAYSYKKMSFDRIISDERVKEIVTEGFVKGCNNES